MSADSAPAPSAEFDTNPLWRFSVGLYATTTVRVACLALQDDHGFDVNMVLACLWQERRGGGALTVPDIRRLLAASAGQRERVAQIRGIRRSMPTAARDSALHRALLHAELLGENAVQTELFRAMPCAEPAARGRGLASLRAYAAHEGLVLHPPSVDALLQAEAPT